MLEAYTTLGFLAAQTTKLRLGTMVTAATFRAPAPLIKAVTTLDVLSGCRAWLGVGAATTPTRPAPWGCTCPATRAIRVAGDCSTLLTACGAATVLRSGESSCTRIIRFQARLRSDHGGYHLFDIPDGGQTLQHKLEVRQRHCLDLGAQHVVLIGRGRPFSSRDCDVVAAAADRLASSP